MDIKKILERKKKVRTSVTLEREVFEKLEAYKEANNIDSLAPMINEMLKDWLIKNGNLQIAETKWMK